MFGERSEVVNRSGEAPIKTFQPLKTITLYASGNHTMVEKPYYGREGRANQCCSGIVEKLIINAWKKIIQVTKTFEKLVGYFLESIWYGPSSLDDSKDNSHDMVILGPFQRQF